jgi:tetratricopeptide (TPR) repeat protein
MDMMTNKLLQQAGKYVLLGKLSLALEEYLKIHELAPEDTTVMNMIADLYNRMEVRQEALDWYRRLAEAFEFRHLPANAIAVYRKILKLAPKNFEAMSRLAELYQSQGQLSNARMQYKIIANQWINAGEVDKALDLLRRVCDMQPDCPESRIELGQVLEGIGRKIEACHAYLEAAELWTRQDNLHAAVSAAENILRLKPKDRDFIRSFICLLPTLNLADRGMEYLHSISLDQDPEFKTMIGEVFLQGGNLQVAQKFLLTDVRRNPKAYPAAMRMLRQLIQNGDLASSLDVAEALIEAAIRQRDELNLKTSLQNVLQLDPSSARTLKLLSDLLIRTDDRKQLEEHLRRLVIVHLQGGNLREARDSLNKLVVYARKSYYLDLLNQLNDGMVHSSNGKLREICRTIVHTLEEGGLDQEENPSLAGMALGVTDLDLGLSLGFQSDKVDSNEPAEVS